MHMPLWIARPLHRHLCALLWALPHACLLIRASLAQPRMPLIFAHAMPYALVQAERLERELLEDESEARQEIQQDAFATLYREKDLLDDEMEELERVERERAQREAWLKMQEAEKAREEAERAPPPSAAEGDGEGSPAPAYGRSIASEIRIKKEEEAQEAKKKQDDLWEELQRQQAENLRKQKEAKVIKQLEKDEKQARDAVEQEAAVAGQALGQTLTEATKAVQERMQVLLSTFIAPPPPPHPCALSHSAFLHPSTHFCIPPLHDLSCVHVFECTCARACQQISRGTPLL